MVATSAMLAFISFWRVAAIVLNDMGSSAFYAGAISEHFIGKTAPWFVLAIMLLAGTVASLYIESCGMFVRGGVYRVVKEAMGGTLAKFSVSALMFDYILTGQRPPKRESLRRALRASGLRSNKPWGLGLGTGLFPIVQNPEPCPREGHSGPFRHFS